MIGLAKFMMDIDEDEGPARSLSNDELKDEVEPPEDDEVRGETVIGTDSFDASRMSAFSNKDGNIDSHSHKNKFLCEDGRRMNE